MISRFGFQVQSLLTNLRCNLTEVDIFSDVAEDVVEKGHITMPLEVDKGKLKRPDHLNLKGNGLSVCVNLTLSLLRQNMETCRCKQNCL